MPFERKQNWKAAMPPPDPRGMSLLQHARTGDLQAFRQLVCQYQPEVFGLALQLTGNHSDAFEIAQDVFVQLHAAIARIASHPHLRHWLLRTVVQQAAGRPWQPADELEAGVTLPDPGADFTARVMARVELRWSHRREDFGSTGIRRKQHWRGPGVLIGVVSVIGLAAMLALWMSGRFPKPATAPHPEAGSAAASSASEAATPAGTDPAVTAAASPASRPVATQDAYPHYTLIVLPLRHASVDANSLAPAEAFHAALVAELRKVPGLALLIPGVSAPPETLKSAEYLLTVTSLEARTLPSGGTAFRIADSRGGGSLSAASPAPGRQWPVEIRIQPIAKPESPGFTSTLQIGDDTAQFPQLAAKQLELLRVRIFPDALVKQQLIARIRDAALPAMERNAALDDLLGTQRERGSELNSVDIGIIVAGAAAMPADERARLWRSLRGAPHSDLVDTLLDSMRRDPEVDVRFEALATLTADYGSEARVRSAIESVAREDTAQVMRMAAQRTRNGDAEWRRYLVSALKDTTLPWPERLAPLLLAGRSATTPAEILGMRTMMDDEEIMKLVAGMIRDSWFDYTQTQTISDALTLLATAGNPVALGLLVEIPPEGSRPGAASVAPMPQAQISPAAMAWLSKNRNNPRARRILDDIARGRVDPQLEFMIQQMMQQRPPPRR